MTTTDKTAGAEKVARRDIHSLTRGELAELLAGLGQPSFRAKQVEEWVWSKNARSFDDMTNLP